MPPKIGLPRLASIFPCCTSARCITCPPLPISVPLGRIQEAQVKKLGAGAPKFGWVLSVMSEKANWLVVLLPLKPCQLGWLKILNASARISRLMCSVLGILKVFFNDISSRSEEHTSELQSQSN